MVPVSMPAKPVRRTIWVDVEDLFQYALANPRPSGIQRLVFEILRVLRLHIDQGVRIIRLDAVAFLWKQPCSPSIHLPQTHAVVKLMRALADFAAEKVILLTETNVPKATIAVEKKCIPRPTRFQPKSMTPRKPASRKKALSTS